MGAHEVPPSAPRERAPDDPSERSLDDLSERSLGELISQLTGDVSTLLRQEVELAKAEVRQEAAAAAKAGAVLGGGALAGYFALLLVSFAAAWGLAEVVAPGVAFLIVGVLYAVVSAALIVAGRRRLQDINPVPEQTVETVKEDAQWAKNRIS